MARTIYAQEPQEYNKKLAEALKQINEMKTPEWVEYVKTSSAKQRPSEDEDFWYKRSASILRQLYIRGVVGVGRLRTRYGARKNRGSRPAKFRKGSGKIVRVILQQAEAAGFIEKVVGRQFGRRLTQKGRDFLDSIKVGEVEEKEEEAEVKEVKQEETSKPERRSKSDIKSDNMTSSGNMTDGKKK